MRTSSDLPTFLYVELSLAIIPVIFSTFYYPSMPANPPSAAAEALRTNLMRNESFNSDSQAGCKCRFQLPKSFLNDVLHCITVCLQASYCYLSLQSISTLLVILAGGIEGGVTAGWSGCLPQILADIGYTSQQAGWIGFAFSVAGGLLFPVSE